MPLTNTKNKAPAGTEAAIQYTRQHYSRNEQDKLLQFSGNEVPLKTATIWALMQGRVSQPIRCQPVPPPPHPALQGMGSLNVPDETTFGPMTHSAARSFASAMFDYKTLCIITGDRWQAIMITGRALQLAQEALGYSLPGMMFFPDDCEGILLIGHGEHFEDIHTGDVIASCTPGMAFPVGRVWAAPEQYNRQAKIRPSARENWTPPSMCLIDDLMPLAEYLRSHASTNKDLADFQIAEALRVAESKQKIEETAAWWAAKTATASPPNTNSRSLLP
jgi:hypothetical protein